MKFVRKFPDAATRNAVFAQVDYNILSYVRGVGIKIKTEGSSPDYSTPFYVENTTEDEVTMCIIDGASTHPIFTVEYSYDNIEWNTLGTTDEYNEFTLQPSDKVYLRAETDTWCYGEGMTSGVQIYRAPKVGGNIMSLLYGSNFTGRETSFSEESSYNFAYLFATDEMDHDYFFDASELILPAQTLTEGCYRGMFTNCVHLESAPVLSATTLVDSCYAYMFYNCPSLYEITIYANEGPFNPDISNCIQNWLGSCADEGQLHNLGTAIFAEDYPGGCPVGWTADHPEYVIPLD